MAGSYQDLFAFLEKLGEKLEELTELQKEKTRAVRTDDLLAVNECMKKEQVISLSLRGMEIEREKLLRELGLENLPLSAMPERCPAEKRAEARSAAERLRNRYLVYQSAAQVSRSTLEVNLHQIEKIIADEERDDAPPPVENMADIRA